MLKKVSKNILLWTFVELTTSFRFLASFFFWNWRQTCRLKLGVWTPFGHIESYKRLKKLLIMPETSLMHNSPGSKLIFCFRKSSFTAIPFHQKTNFQPHFGKKMSWKIFPVLWHKIQIKKAALAKRNKHEAKRNKFPAKETLRSETPF